jgi:hypothetical protein
LYARELLASLLDEKELKIIEIVWQDEDQEKQVKALLEPKDNV